MTKVSRKNDADRLSLDLMGGLDSPRLQRFPKRSSRGARPHGRAPTSSTFSRARRGLRDESVMADVLHGGLVFVFVRGFAGFVARPGQLFEVRQRIGKAEATL